MSAHCLVCGGADCDDPAHLYRRTRRDNPAQAALPFSEPDTSRAAAESMRDAGGVLRKRVLDYLRSRPTGATSEEIQAALNLPGSTVRPRVWELRGNGGHPVLIRDSGDRRPTKSGRSAKVWSAIP